MSLITEPSLRAVTEGRSVLDPDGAAPATGGNLAFAAHELLRVMALAREGDRREGILYRQGKGWLQVPGVGHEALAAIVHCLAAQDFLYPYYRQRAISLARGMTNYELALAFFAK